MKNLMLVAGLMIACVGCSTNEGTTTTSSTNSPEAAQPTVPVTRTVALKVPTMHCPIVCWPNVQKALAAEEGVGVVTLAEQAVEGEIDNPVVYVGVNDDFDVDHAVAMLADAGFKNAVVEEKKGG